MNEKLNLSGKATTFNFYNIDPSQDLNTEHVRSLLVEALEDAGFNPVSTTAQALNPKGAYVFSILPEYYAVMAYFPMHRSLSFMICEDSPTERATQVKEYISKRIKHGTTSTEERPIGIN
jgi:S-adenosylmethionine/arginine decarboxylase-like enzyme